MANATVHPNHALISSEDVEGTDVYDTKGNKVGDIDHLMIDKMSGRVSYAVMSWRFRVNHNLSVPALKYDTSLEGYVTGSAIAAARRARVQRRPWVTETGKHSRTAFWRGRLLVTPCRRNRKHNRRRRRSTRRQTASSRSQSSLARQRCTAR